MNSPIVLVRVAQAPSPLTLNSALVSVNATLGFYCEEVEAGTLLFATQSISAFEDTLASEI